MQEKLTLIIFKTFYLVTCFMLAVILAIASKQLSVLLKGVSSRKIAIKSWILLFSFLILISITLILFTALDATSNKWRFLVLTLLQRIEEDLLAFQFVNTMAAKVKDMNWSFDGLEGVHSSKKEEIQQDQVMSSEEVKTTALAEELNEILISVNKLSPEKEWEEIGRGGFSKVYKARYKSQAVAIKLYNSNVGFKREVRALRYLDFFKLILIVVQYNMKTLSLCMGSISNHSS